MKHVAEFLGYAAYLGVERARIQTGRRHPLLVGFYKGRSIKFAFAGTPGDHRAMMNARCQLRRNLGLTHSGKRLRA